MTLEEIFRKHGTDKVDMHHYAQHYERHLRHLRSNKFRMLEIGVGLGQSLAAWEDYFRAAEVIGLDIDPKELPFAIHRGHQADPRVITAIVNVYDRFEVIIDDGSHRSEDVIPTLLMLWQFLSPTGIYVPKHVEPSLFLRRAAFREPPDRQERLFSGLR